MAEKDQPARTSQRTLPVVDRSSSRPTIAAKDVGVTLTISARALEEMDRIHDETIKAAQEAQKFSLR